MQTAKVENLPINDQVQEVLELENQLVEQENELVKQNDQFQQFINFQKSTQSKISLIWKTIEDEMINRDIKSVKGDWGSVTICERVSFDIDVDLLPAKYIKKVPDTTKIGQAFKLEGKPVKGTTPKYTKYIMKRIK